jgi:hypothetical protein
MQSAVVKMAPEWLINRQVMGIHQGMRAAYYRRQARLQAEAAAAAAAGAGAGEEGGESPTKRELRRRK